jgi:hypothetical protein
MNSFYKLACALVAWSALSLSAQATAMQSLSALPEQAFQISSTHPEHLGYLSPGVNLANYQSIMIEPLTMLGKHQGDWTVLVAAAQSPEAQRFQQTLTQTLALHGLQVVDQAGPGVMRLRLALSIGDTPHAPLATQNSINLEHLADGVDHYMAQVAAVGQLEDSLSGALLAGGVDLKDQLSTQHESQIQQPELSQVIRLWTEHSAQRVAHALEPLLT